MAGFRKGQPFTSSEDMGAISNLFPFWHSMRMVYSKKRYFDNSAQVHILDGKTGGNQGCPGESSSYSLSTHHTKKIQWHAMAKLSRVAEWRSREWWWKKCPSEAVSLGQGRIRRRRAGAGQRERRQGAPKARLLTPAPHTVLSPASFAAQDALPLKPQDRAQAEEAKRRSRARIGCISWGHRSAPNQ